MNLEQIAQQAMDYLDTVGVAAEYDIKNIGKSIKTESKCGDTKVVGYDDDFEVFIITDDYIVSEVNPKDSSYLIRKMTECLLFPFIPRKSPE